MKKSLLTLIMILIVSISFAQLGSGYSKSQANDRFATKSQLTQLDTTTLKKDDGLLGTDYFMLKDTAEARLDKKANLYHPDLVSPTANTLAAGTNTTGLATTAFVYNASIYNNVTIWPLDGVSGLPINHTGTITEDVILTIPIPAGVIRANSRIDIVGSLTCNSSTNQKYLQFYIDAVVGGQAIAKIGNNGTTGVWLQFWSPMWCRNSVASQIKGAGDNQTGAIIGWAASLTSSAPITRTIDFSVSHNLIITAKCPSLSTDNIKIETLQISIQP